MQLAGCLPASPAVVAPATRQAARQLEQHHAVGSSVAASLGAGLSANAAAATVAAAAAAAAAADALTVVCNSLSLLYVIQRPFTGYKTLPLL